MQHKTVALYYWLPPFGFKTPHLRGLPTSNRFLCLFFCTLFVFKELLMQPQARPPSQFPMLCQGTVALGTPPPNKTGVVAPLSPFLLFPNLGTVL